MQLLLLLLLRNKCELQEKYHTSHMQYRSNLLTTNFRRCSPPTNFINRGISGNNIRSEWQYRPSERQIIRTNIMCHKLKDVNSKQRSRNTVNNFISSKNVNANECCCPNCHFMTSQSSRHFPIQPNS